MFDLQVEVNGQESFSLSMNVVSVFSGKVRRLLGINSTDQGFKLILPGFPGGAEGFELIARFCYCGGRIDLSPSNVILLHAAAKFLEITETQTTNYLENTTHLWTWSETLDCLKQYQELLSFMNSSSSSSYAVQEILDALVEKMAGPINISSPFPYFTCSESSLFSGDVITSTNSSRSSSGSHHHRGWFQDLEFLGMELFDKVSSTMISRKLDRRIVCSFLAHYQKVKTVGLLPSDQRCRIVEVLITRLCSLDGIGPFRSLWDLLRICVCSKMSNFWVRKVEVMIGGRLDEATLDDLLVRARKGCAYDAGLVLRLLRVFLGQKKNIFFVQRLEKVGLLVDLYLAEVAPDRKLKPSKFLAIALCLPASAREFHDRFFEAIDMYFKVHKRIGKEEKKRICSGLSYDKLSSESLVNIAKNPMFPASAAAAALLYLQSESENMSQDVANLEWRSNSSFFANEDLLILAQLRKGKEYKKLQKKFGRCF